MEISAKMVGELRQRTNAGIMNCKKALIETDGDMEKAIEVLREKGLAAAAKKAGRIAAEGLIETFISEDGRTAAIVEVNCETDFVGKNEDFMALAKNIAKQIASSNATTVEELNNEKYIADESKTVQEFVTGLVAKIGENLAIRRFERFNIEKGGIYAYLHTGARIGVAVSLESENENGLTALAKELCLQIAFSNPVCLTSDEVSPELIAKEREIYKQQALQEGKPEKIVDKMVEGRLQKYFKEICLVEQAWIRDQDKTIKKLIAEKEKENGAPIKIAKYVRFEKGEGIEKKEENFAEEVMKQINS